MAQERREVEITIKVQHNGYGADVTATCLVEHIPGLIARLAEHGITPANSPYVWEGQGNGQAQPAATNGTPLCPVHHTKMKRSKHNDGWYCTRKLDDGAYCKETVA